MRRMIVLDRDGTVIAERHYLSNPADVELLPGTASGLQRLARHGYEFVVVTNQSGVGRGYFTLAQLDAVHTALRERLAEVGVTLAGVYSCPHSPAEGCGCRKPGTDLLLRAATECGFEPAACVVVGDKPSDIALGRAVGATTVLVRTGYGRENEHTLPRADHVVEDLDALAELLTG